MNIYTKSQKRKHLVIIMQNYSTLYLNYSTYYTCTTSNYKCYYTELQNELQKTRHHDAILNYRSWYIKLQIKLCAQALHTS